MHRLILASLWPVVVTLLGLAAAAAWLLGRAIGWW